MVNVEEINTSITKFGEIVDGLEKVQHIYTELQKSIQTQDALIIKTNEALELLDKIKSDQKEFLMKQDESLTRRFVDIESSLRKHISNSEGNVKNEFKLECQDLKTAIDLLMSQICIVEENNTEKFQIITNSILSVKKHIILAYGIITISALITYALISLVR